MSGGTSIWLPVSPRFGQSVSIADIAGNALDYNIVINGNGKCINGATCSTINTDYGSVTFINNGIFWSAVAYIN